ncbi:hypothetical protein [Streptomyces sp. NBC_00094]|uniref:hypothetical protein n=1 Tax=Streptomyces sp. NBC_00094 TaxID=2903620 RepID=UPI00225B2AF9|nr:hypothetical protein [Streptomyces sp. NBC_00094]MCX5393590.1 hypothetical protein [Streptomyces sp. NBC_00094]
MSGADPGPGDGRAARLDELARVVTERFGLDADGYRHGPCRAEREADDDTWTLAWTDGPTVEQVLREAGPEGEGLPCRRRLSEETVALGAVRLATGVPWAPGGAARPRITPEAVERLWYDVPFPRPATDRERALVYAVVYEARDNSRANRVPAGRICDLVAATGLAPFAERMRIPLTPVELLTARYAAAHGHPAWRYRLAPLDAPTLLRAVLADRRASAELLAAALTLASGPDGEHGAVADELRERLRRPWP